MELKILLVFIHFLCLTIYEILGSSSVDCNYSNYDFWAVGYKYRCLVSNNLNISSPESAIIDAVNGTHLSGKSNNDEIYFHAYNKHIEYFPRGLEKFFTNLTGILISGSQLKEIYQDDLKPYTKLKYFQLSSNFIEVIEDGLFDFQPDIEVIIFGNCKIFHISSTVFDNLSKLTSLYLEGNKCINKESQNNRIGVLEVIKSVKSTCMSPEYIKLDEKLKNLEQSSKNLNADNLASFKVNFKVFKLELKNSKFSRISSLNDRVHAVFEWNHEILLQCVTYYKNVEKMLIINDNKTQNYLETIQDKLDKSHDNNTKELQNLNQQISSMSTTLANIKSESNNKLESVQNDLKTTKATIDSSLNAQKSSLDVLISSKVNDLNNNMTTGQQAIKDSVTAIDNRFTSIDDRFITTEDKLSILETRITALNTRITSQDQKMTSLDTKVKTLEDKIDRLTDSISQIVSTMQGYKSDLNDHMSVVKDKITQSSEINGTWKSTLVACCTFLVTLIIFIAYKKFLYYMMTWEEDQ